VINTPSVRTTGASRHALVVDELIVGEMQCDLLLHPNFFYFLARIYAFRILREQSNKTTAAILAVFVIFVLRIWPFNTVDTSPFFLPRLIAGIECRECCTTASAFCTRVFVLAMYTSPSGIPCLYTSIEFRERFASARAFCTRVFVLTMYTSSRLFAGIEFRECFTTARALFTSVFDHIMNTDPTSFFAQCASEYRPVVNAK